MQKVQVASRSLTHPGTELKNIYRYQKISSVQQGKIHNAWHSQIVKQLCLKWKHTISSLAVLRSIFTHFFFFFFGLFRATPGSYGSFQARSQIRAYITATAMQDLSRICNLHHSSQQCQILNPLSEARDRTSVLMDTSWIRYCCTTVGTPPPPSSFFFFF